MKISYEPILSLLSKNYTDKDFKKSNLRVDILGREDILSLYKLRLEISIEKGNKEGVIICTEIIEELSKMEGEILYSIYYCEDNINIIGFIDEYLKILYTFPQLV